MSKPKKAWPKVPEGRETFHGCFTDGHPDPHRDRSNTACKHGLGECEECGTTSRRDAIHTTEGGRGKVGKLFKKRG